jgi:hypothetical protein
MWVLKVMYHAHRKHEIHVICSVRTSSEESNFECRRWKNIDVLKSTPLCRLWKYRNIFVYISESCDEAGCGINDQGWYFGQLLNFILLMTSDHVWSPSTFLPRVYRRLFGAIKASEAWSYVVTSSYCIAEVQTITACFLAARTTLLHLEVSCCCATGSRACCLEAVMKCVWGTARAAVCRFKW